MKKLISLLIIAALVAGAVSTAFAEEIDDISLMITEGKIQAAEQQLQQEQQRPALKPFRTLLLEVIANTRKRVADLQEKIAMDTEMTNQSSNGNLSALGQIDRLLAELETEAKNATDKDEDRAYLNEISKLVGRYNILVNEIEYRLQDQ